MPTATLAAGQSNMKSLLSIGHSNLDIEKFVTLLKANDVRVIADTRSQPYSKHTPHFSREELEAALYAAGIGYVFFGDELGGRPRGREYYDEDGHVLYWKVADSEFFRHGVERLERWRRRYPAQNLALLCSEENPLSCHRRLLVGKVLYDAGWDIRHIRSNGQVQSEKALREEEAAAPPKQIKLGEDPEAGTWKSTRSVSPRNPHGSSSPR